MQRRQSVVEIRKEVRDSVFIKKSEYLIAMVLLLIADILIDMKSKT